MLVNLTSFFQFIGTMFWIPLRRFTEKSWLEIQSKLVYVKLSTRILSEVQNLTSLLLAVQS
jgi:hypothetical protein